jgi:hypothetical protein
MAHEHSVRRYRHWYAKLLRLYSKPYYERFGEGMEQTFSDLLHERRNAERGLFAFAVWIFFETFVGIVRENITFTIMRNKNILRIALATGFILLIPLVAMQFTSEVAWTLSDFVFAGVLLFGAGLTYELVARKGDTVTYRLAAGVAVATGLLLIWVDLAVGIIGDEENPDILMYIGVLAVGIVGAIIARFRPHGMARALFVTAFAQMLVAVIALIVGMHHYPGSSASEILGVNGFFAALFTLSALLFQRAAGERNGPEVEPTA